MALITALVLAAGCTGQLGTTAAPAATEWQPVECMSRAEVEAALGLPVGPEKASGFTPENPCGAEVGWVGESPGVAGMITVPYEWGSVDYVSGVAVGWAESGALGSGG